MNKEVIQYLVFDIESIPDAKLINKVKYPDMDYDDKKAVATLQEEMLEITQGRSNFIPVTFQIPVSLCIAKVRENFTLAEIVSLDQPNFRARTMTTLFWHGIEDLYNDSSMVTFNGRGFDIPLMELMAFRYGVKAKRHFKDKYAGRYRFGTKHIDLQDWVSNYNAIKVAGGLNMLAKTIGKPGKMSSKGDQVYGMYLEGKMKEINEYCIHDVLDTYFVFLRTRVLLGEITIDREQTIVNQTKEYLIDNVGKIPAFKEYLDNWGDWDPWPV
jgi:3'-5' exonuclease